MTAAWHGPAFLYGEEGPCDPYLKPLENDPSGYRLRGDRCEGTYVKEVAAAGTLQVVSFTESFAEYDLTSGKDLLIEWTPRGENQIRLRTYSLRRKLYYRMDTVRPPGSSSYAWPSGMLAIFRLGRAETGLVGSTQQLIGGVRRDVLLPLTVRSRGDLAVPKRLELVLYPSVDLGEVFVSLAPVDPRGLPGRFLMNGEPLRYGYYPADRGLPIKLPELKVRGLYFMEIGATLGSGGAATTNLWFHSGG
jgi:hypothetical protein